MLEMSIRVLALSYKLYMVNLHVVAYVTNVVAYGTNSYLIFCYHVLVNVTLVMCGYRKKL